MKNCLILLAIASVFVLMSCGGVKDEKESDKDVVAPICEMENSISVSVQDYHYSMSDTLKLDLTDFEVKASDYMWIDDSTVSLKISNYTIEELLGSKTPEQLDIIIDINARKGEILEGGYYGYQAYEEGKWSRVTLLTAYGTVGFHSLPDMPDEGGVTIEHISKDAICGTLAINVDNPEDPMIGTVKLNGTFVHKEKE